jgi:protein-S-isoprenylcysteine O-methyltransferase Ste14
MKHLRVNVILTIVVAAAAFLSIRGHAPKFWGATQFFGLGLLILGFVFWTVARFQLGASLTVTAQARKLVNTGLYSKIRNPIYVFGSCFLVGLILVIAHPVWLLAFVIIIPFQSWRAGKEAQVLEASFGDAYRAYRARTWF